MTLESDSVRQDDFSEACGRCRRLCCKEARVPVHAERIRIIERALSTAGIPIETPFENQGYTFPRETTNGCVFFDPRTKRCLIQSVKPELCVAYPVTFDINLNEGTIEWYLHTEEVCPLSGVLTRSNALFTQHLDSAKREITTFIRGLEEEELRTVLAIEVPAAVKIGEDPIDVAVLERLKRK